MLPRPVLWALYGVSGLLGVAVVVALAVLLWQGGWYGWLVMQKHKPAPELWRAMLTYARWSRFWHKHSLPKTPLEWLEHQPLWIQTRWCQPVHQLNHFFFGQNHPFG